MPIDVVILAGAPAGVEMSPDDPNLSRAMLPIGPKTMLQWVVDALRSAQSVGRIIAVGNVSADGLDGAIAPAGSFLENLILGVEACGDDERVLVCTSDIPMLTAEAVDDFVARALESGGEMCYPIIPMAACTAKYPQMKRTSLKLREGEFTGGNITVLSTDFVRRNRGLILKAYAARKKPLALASMIGLGLLLRVSLSQWIAPRIMPLQMIEHKASLMLAGKVVAIPTDYAEIGSDVDKPSDLAQAREILGSPV